MALGGAALPLGLQAGLPLVEGFYQQVGGGLADDALFGAAAHGDGDGVAAGTAVDDGGWVQGQAYFGPVAGKEVGFGGWGDPGGGEAVYAEAEVIDEAALVEDGDGQGEDPAGEDGEGLGGKQDDDFAGGFVPGRGRPGRGGGLAKQLGGGRFFGQGQQQAALPDEQGRMAGPWFGNAGQELGAGQEGAVGAA